MLTLFAVLLSGCMQIETTVKLERDGGATITERVEFSHRLLELSGAPGSDTDIAGLLSKATAEERGKHFGKGARIEKEPVIRDVEGGGREMLTVYRIDDLNELRYVSPFLCMKDYAKHNTFKFTYVPHYGFDGTYLQWDAGVLGIRTDIIDGGEGNEADPNVPSPALVQTMRDLEPMFCDMLGGFKMRLTFQTFAGIQFTHWGNRISTMVNGSLDLFSVSDKDLDRTGGKFFENEEVMLELLQGKFARKNLVATVKEWNKNETVPVLIDWGAAGADGANWRAGNEIIIRPSQAMFDRFFKGHELEFYGGSGRPTQKRQANFDEIGAK